MQTVLSALFNYMKISVSVSISCIHEDIKLTVLVVLKKTAEQRFQAMLLRNPGLDFHPPH